MKNLIFLVIAIGLSACCKRGHDGVNGSVGTPGVSCSATPAPGGVMIACTDGSSSFVADGAAGSNGTNGSNGSNGTNGTDGHDGLNGSNGSNGNDGHDGSNGLNGSNGTNGTNGQDGTNGTNGSNGTNGTNGTDGTLITIVQLCTSPTVYPTTFTEVAFCIDHNLYAVYSENNGFLSIIPPGNYSSVGHNSTCSVTILPNCAISH